MTKSRVFLFCLLAFIAGVSVASFIPFPVAVIWIGGVGIFCVIAFGARHQNLLIVVAGLIALCFAGGAFRYAAVMQSAPDLTEFEGRAIRFEGVVIREPVLTEKSQQITVRGRIRSPEDAIGRETEEFRMRVVSRPYPRYAFGDALTLEGVLASPLDRDAPYRALPRNYLVGGRATLLMKEGIFGTIVFPRIEKTGAVRGFIIMRRILGAKNALTAGIDRMLPDPHAALLRGLLLGERAALPEETVGNFRASGVSHIVALSGYNITLVGRSFMAGLLWASIPFRASFWIASGAIILFIVMVGASPSVTRAGILGLLLLVAEREGRVYNIRNALAFAAAAMVFVNPLILRFDAAFQLSFCATIGLVYFSGPVEKYMDRSARRIRRFFGDYKVLKRRGNGFISRRVGLIKRLLVETIAAQIAVLPLLIILFGAISLVSPLANMFVLLAVPFAMAWGFVTGLWGMLRLPFGGMVAGVAWLALEYILRVSAFFARIPFASVPAGKWVAILLLIAIAAFVLRKRLRTVRFPQT
ncbi:MAG: ComEC/Rec2 family competence protein [Patescibacteria group bacterium]